MSKFFLRLVRLIFFTLAISVLAVFLFASYKEKTVENNGNKKHENVPFRIASLTGEHKLQHAWTYNGQQYSIDLTLFQSAYDFYKNQLKVYEYEADNLPSDWKNEYFGIFLREAENDDAIENLVQEIKAQGETKKLSPDQIVELTLAFVQSLPYDDNKAKLILSSDDEDNLLVLPRYPYETLFDKQGICSDKSILAYTLIRQLGYGTALFVYPDANHMALGIQCPLEYSESSAGYCYAETTTPGHLIGIVPQLDETRKAIPTGEKSSFESQGEALRSNLILENPEIYQKTTAASYDRIAITFKTQKELNRLEKYLASLNSEMASLGSQVKNLEQDISALRKKMDSYKKEKDYDKYNELVPKYNGLVENYKKLIKQYNTKISDYNKNVSYYNKLIKELSILE
jgi:hypothetical protein